LFAAFALMIAMWVPVDPLYGQDHSKHASHRMILDESGMVMNHNEDELPRDCQAISREYEFKVSAGTEFAQHRPGLTFGYDRNEFEVEPCALVRITLTSVDEVRHQWMLHGLPRYLYPGGMFHLEAAGGHTVSGSFIVPSDDRTYLVHCDITQHMEKGMKAQLKVGKGSGDLWAVPGISKDFRRATYLPRRYWYWFALLLMAIPVSTLAIIFARRH